MGLGKITDEFLKFRDCLRGIELDVQRKLQAAILQMQMRILEARKYDAATGIDHARGGAGQGLDRSIVAQGRDALAGNRKGRSARHQWIHRVDVGIGDDEFRMWRNHGRSALRGLRRDHTLLENEAAIEARFARGDDAIGFLRQIIKGEAFDRAHRP